jgi:hypothetical protein
VTAHPSPAGTCPWAPRRATWPSPRPSAGSTSSPSSSGITSPWRWKPSWRRSRPTGRSGARSGRRTAPRCAACSSGTRTSSEPPASPWRRCSSASSTAPSRPSAIACPAGTSTCRTCGSSPMRSSEEGGCPAPARTGAVPGGAGAGAVAGGAGRGCAPPGRRAAGFAFRPRGPLGAGQAGVRPGPGGVRDQPRPLREPPTTGGVRETLRLLTDALRRRKRVRFRYHGIHRGQPTDRDVAPYGLLYNHGHWYLIGHDATRDAIRVFRLGRMEAPVVDDSGPGPTSRRTRTSMCPTTPGASRGSWATSSRCPATSASSSPSPSGPSATVTGRRSGGWRRRRRPPVPGPPDRPVPALAPVLRRRRHRGRGPRS